MSAFIKLNKQDAFVAPYTAHKPYSYTNQADRISAGIRFRLGTRFTGSKEDTPTNLNRFFSSANQLYYSNYSSSLESGSFDNHNQSTLHFTRSLGDDLTIISIPRDIYGENIKPGTFKFNSGSVFHITDDGEGNLFASGSTSFDLETSSSISTTTTTSTFSSSIAVYQADDVITFTDALSGMPSAGTLDRIEWLGNPPDSPFYLNAGVTQVSDITDSAILSNIDTSVEDELTSNDINEIRFTDNGDNISLVRLTFTSSSTETITTEIYPSASIANNELLGNIFYSHGMAILTKSNIAKRFQEQVLRSGSLEWKGSYTVFEHTYQCRSNQSQLNFTQNPSSFKNTPESGSIINSLTGSYFQPYITTVGLYNDTNELIAVGKLGQPVPKSQHIDMTFVIKFDV